MIEKLTHEDFAKGLHEQFVIHHDEGTIQAELIDCRKLASPGAPASQREPFAVIFRGPREPVLVQRIYRIEGPSLGPLEIFIVPVGPDAEGMRYEAIFS